ncbi:MAG TPA: hypothetical protein VGM21_15520 [Actinomycetota bacterium]|jgi:hypothetical protein
MTTVLVVLTVVEVAIVVAVLAAYLVLIDRHLRAISAYLGKLAFGVRAVETQTGPIGPSVTRINATLREIDAALGPIAERASNAVEARGQVGRAG